MSEKQQILLLSDWPKVTDQVHDILSKDPYSVTLASLSKIKSSLSEKSYDLVILCLPQENINQDMRKILEIKQNNDALPIIVISNNQDLETVIKIMKLGVNEFERSPIDKEKLKKLVATHAKLYKMTKKIFYLEDEDKVLSSYEGMVGGSPQMQENFRMITAVSKSNATVLISGESGTGKELVAKAIHKKSNRISHRFVDLNCGAIPRDLLENELFGHEKGSFTGAHKRYQGSFEVAHLGTLFLDEISEMDPLLQVKLLRVLQERSFMRIGGTEKIDVDVRIIAATNRNLQKRIEEGLFREDLFYRLNVLNVVIPPLRERREDIPLLANHFLEYYTTKNDRIFMDFSSEALESLINYEWPGNVRELENTIERIVVLHNDSQVKLKHLPKQVQKVNRQLSLSDVSTVVLGEEAQVIPLEDLEKKAIEIALMKYQGNISVVAKKLKIGQATLYRKVKKFGLTQVGNNSEN